MAEPMVKIYSHSQFDQLLSMFQSAVDCGEYTEKIPYDTWRRLKKLSGNIKVEYCSPFVKISYLEYTAFGEEVETVVFSVKTYNNGFGRFFYDYVVKKENERMTLNSATSAASACDAVGAKTSVLEIKADYMGASDVAYATALTGKTAYDDNGYSYYGTDSTSTAKIAEPNRTNTIELNIPSLDQFGYHQIDGTWDSVASRNEVNERFKKLEAELQKKVDKAEKNECVKENDTMMKGINFDFGPCGNTVRLSMYGMAIQNISGEWVSYNPDSREIINVDVFNMADGGKYMYKMPVAIADVKEGDIVIHNRVPMFVTAINENGTFEVTDVRAGETKNIIPTRSPFGFNFMTKIVSLFNGLMTPDKNNPFGNMWMFAMMSGDNNFDMKDVLMISMMTGNNDFVGNMNPMMLMFMMDDKNEKNDWLMPLMLMNSGMMNQPHVCNCDKHAEKPTV